MLRPNYKKTYGWVLLCIYGVVKREFRKRAIGKLVNPKTYSPSHGGNFGIVMTYSMTAEIIIQFCNIKAGVFQNVVQQ